MLIVDIKRCFENFYFRYICQLFNFIEKQKQMCYNISKVTVQDYEVKWGLQHKLNIIMVVLL